MKKILFSCCLSLVSIGLFATHLMGGEITVQDLGNGEHQIVLLAYRDTIGIPMDTSATFHFSGPQGQMMSSTCFYDSIISGNLLPMYPYGVEVYLFVDTVSFLTPGMWQISWSDCCRNGAIQNLGNPLSENMLLETSFNIDSTFSNSTPFFLVPAAIFLPVNTPWQYNPLPFDVDGDSLSWSLDTPMTGLNAYCANYTHPSSDPANPFSINPATGTISWTADNLGNYVASILVDQYRNGNWIGRIRRDMQLIVVPDSLGHPFFANLGNLPTDSDGNYSFGLIAGQGFSIEMIAGHTDSTAGRPLFMNAYSEIFQDPQKNAQFQTTPHNQNQLKGSFT